MNSVPESVFTSYNSDTDSEFVPYKFHNNEDDESSDKTKKSRKRKRDISKHKKVIRKQKRDAGETYVSTSGKIVPKKHFSDLICGCTAECNKRVTTERREQIFKTFYSGNWDSQEAFVMTHVDVIDKKRKYTSSQNSRRTSSRIYKLPSFSDSSDITVCKKFFRETLQISDGRIDLILKRKNKNGGPIADKRGRHEPYNKTKTHVFENVCEFIKGFPSYNSHYSRSDNPEKKYLAPNLTLSEMYRLYSARFPTEKVGLSTFRKIFNEKFNLSFYKPRSDTCDKCDAFAIKIKFLEGIEKIEALELQEIHQKEAEAARQAKRKDIEKANECENKRVLVFDLQKTLPTPCLSTGIAYYKRQLWTFNLGIHDEISRTGYMYVWSENQASRGAQEIGSCLYKHIKTFIDTSITHIVLYSDSCGGQNRNIKITLFLSYILQNVPNLKVIEQKFFIPGHSFSSCDQDFAVIEKEKRRHPDVYTPSQWIDLIKNSKKREPKFVVTKMQTQDFKSTKFLEKDIVNRKLDTTGKKVQWLKIRWIKLEKDNPRIFKYKHSFDEEQPFLIVDLAKQKVRGRPITFGNLSVPLLYPDERKLSKEKVKDLEDLLKYIPPVYHCFYKNLKQSEDADDNPYGVEDKE